MLKNQKEVHFLEVVTVYRPTRMKEQLKLKKLQGAPENCRGWIYQLGDIENSLLGIFWTGNEAQSVYKENIEPIYEEIRRSTLMKHFMEGFTFLSTEWGLNS